MDISGDDSDASDSAKEPSSKRARLGLNQSTSDNNTPKWSNPDPYTALPPPDATQQKKKDVVQLIRKARVQAKEAKAAISTEAEEFILCESDSESGSDEEAVNNDSQMPPGVPTGPRNATLPRRPDLPDGPTNPKQPDSSKTTRKSSDSTSATTAAAKPAAPGTSALGSRKRTHDDQIVLPAHARLKKPPKMAADGLLTWEWKVKDGEDPCPWLGPDHSDSANMGVW